MDASLATIEALCRLLAERGVPFVVYSGYPEPPEVCRQDLILRKPASPNALLHSLKRVLER